SATHSAMVWGTASAWRSTSHRGYPKPGATSSSVRAWSSASSPVSTSRAGAASASKISCSSTTTVAKYSAVRRRSATWMPCGLRSARETEADSPRETTLDARHGLDELAPDELRALLHLLESVGVELLEVEIGGGRLVVRRDPARVPEARGTPVA